MLFILHKSKESGDNKDPEHLTCILCIQHTVSADNLVHFGDQSADETVLLPAEITDFCSHAVVTGACQIAVPPVTSQGADAGMNCVTFGASSLQRSQSSLKP